MREENPGNAIRVVPDGEWTEKHHAACLWAAMRFRQALPMLDTMSLEDLYQAAAVRVISCKSYQDPTLHERRGGLGGAAFAGVRDAVRQEWGKDQVRLNMRPLLAELVSNPDPVYGWNEEALAVLAEDEDAVADVQAELDEDPKPKPKPKRRTKSQRCAHFGRQQWGRIMAQLAEARSE